MQGTTLIVFKAAYFLALALLFSTVGQNIPWRFPAWAFAFALLILWGVVSIFALSSKSDNSGWSPQNCGFSFGDILLAAAIGLAAGQVSTLSRELWFMSTGFRVVAVLIGFLVIGPTIEYLGWKGTHRLPFGWGDLYHHALYGLLTCWVLTSLIGTWYYTATRHGFVATLGATAVSLLVTIAILSWLRLVMIQGAYKGPKTFYGWHDLGRAVSWLLYRA